MSAEPTYDEIAPTKSTENSPGAADNFADVVPDDTADDMAPPPVIFERVDMIVAIVVLVVA